MTVKQPLHKFTVTAARGMLPLLSTELDQLGIQKLKSEAGSIRFTGTLKQAYQVCLWSRVAVRVLVPIGHFGGETPGQLYAGIQTIDWSQYIAAEDATLAIDFNSFRSKNSPQSIWCAESQRRHCRSIARQVRPAAISGSIPAGSAG